MKISNTLATVFLCLILTAPMIARSRAEVSRQVAKPTVTVTNAMKDDFSGYKIAVNTTDGGKIVYLFVWQRGIQVHWMGIQGRFIFDTPPILQMSKYLANGTLDFSITYMPLYLLQYNDTNNNDLFDLRTRGYREFTVEVDDDEVEWEIDPKERPDRPYRIYPLAPIFHSPIFYFFEQQYPWSWNVGPLTNKTLTVNNTLTYEYSWNVSATVPTFPWLHEHGFGKYGYGWKTTTVNVSFGYHIRLLPENPEVKYDFNFSDITWANAKNLKLAMMSAVLYHGKELPTVHVGAKVFHGFAKTEEMRVPRFTISENVTKAIKAFISYNPNATIDGTYTPDVVKTALQPLFLIPVPFAPLSILEGVYVRGTYPGMDRKVTWKHYVAFAHQLGLPHFNEYVSQDPVIGLTATLSTTIIPFLPGDLLPLRVIVTVAVAVTAAFTIYYLGKRRITAPIKTV
ncbi:MAG: hypothetical protein QW231_01370 [Candidatus Bathyarchaeia archaeon]